VTLKGEAFFDIKRDPSKPFIIDAGKASIKVLGTSFSVLTSNSKNAVEVFVKTGSVMVSDNIGTQNLVLEPGFIGTMDSNSSSKTVNENPNYLSWNTDLLVYNGKTLDVVFTDLKKVFNIDVAADDPEILTESITTVFDNQPQETIIRIICTTFNLSYKKDGSVYHLLKR
jgi:transmembrane sensor